MQHKKFIDMPEEGFVTLELYRSIGWRRFGVAMVYATNDNRDLTAHRLRNHRNALREFTLEEPKKVVDTSG
jgi:hypothetical protein